MRSLLRTAAGLAITTAFSWAAQVPLSSGDRNSAFDLNDTPSINATGNLVFATASTFLQHWPNTRYRNGHNMVPGTIPPGTLLYHGRGDGNIPQQPEWTATDPEHSLMFCRTGFRNAPPNGTEKGCWHLTLVATRPLNVLYFDGSSAAKMEGGPMDSQDIVSWGKVIHEQVFSEQQRIRDLCDRGKPLGVDGFVRMEMDFEVMLCNFTAGTEVASFLNLERGEFHHGPIKFPNGPPGHPPPEYPPHKHPLRRLLDNLGTKGLPEEAIVSGSWHNHFPGDTRIQLDYSRLVSFYDTSLVPSLVLQRFGKPRLHHRIDGISKEDTSAVMKTLEEVLQRYPSSSGVNWQSIMQVIVDRYSERLETVQYFINQTFTSEASPSSAKRLQAEFSVMAQPYVLYALKPTTDDNHAWASQVFELCATTHTSYLHKIPGLTSSELLLLASLEETTREICRVTTKMWAQGVEAGLDEQVHPEGEPSGADVEGLVKEWGLTVNGLMHWLDWGVWVKCRPACAYDSVCYLPTWPFFSQGPTRAPGSPNKDDRDSKKDYEDPQPRCVPRFRSLES